MKTKTIDSIEQINLINHDKNKFDLAGKEKQSLESVYQYKEKIVIFDNHNHALYYRAKYLIGEQKKLPVIHIDQHSDLSTPPLRNTKTVAHSSLEDRKHVAYVIADIGSFIMPGLDGGLIPSCEQIRTETKLIEYKTQNTPYILDIDLDFRAPEMINDYVDKTLEKTRELITNASLVTIATSPGYIDQEFALEILEKLLKI